MFLIEKNCVKHDFKTIEVVKMISLSLSRAILTLGDCCEQIMQNAAST